LYYRAISVKYNNVMQSTGQVRFYILSWCDVEVM